MSWTLLHCFKYPIVLKAKSMLQYETYVILLKFEKCLYVCLFPIYSAVYRPTATKLGRKVGEGHEKQLAKTEF